MRECSLEARRGTAMFATPTVEARIQAATSPSNKTVRQPLMSQAHRPDWGWDERAQMFQPRIGNLATLRHLSQRGLSPTSKDPDSVNEKESAAENKSAAKAPHSLAWSFNEISIYARDEAYQPQAPSPLAARPLPGVMQQSFGYDLAQVPIPGDVRSAAGELDTKRGNGLDQRDSAAALTTAPAKKATSPAPPAAHPNHGKATQTSAALPKVTLPPHVRAALPESMADRIPPHRPGQAPIGIADLPKGATPIEVSVEGSGGGNGTVTVDGAATATLTESKNVTLEGDAQTEHDKGGKLRLVAKQGAVTLAQSEAFSVSSVPQNFDDNLAFSPFLTGSERGIRVQDDWSSDSGSDSGPLSALSQTSITEVVERGAATGCFARMVFQNSGPKPGDIKSIDEHSSTVADLTSPGEITAKQASVFTDLRTGSSNVPMSNSGYIITRKNVPTNNGKYKITTSKQGADVTANGITTHAGKTSNGAISVTQPV